MVVFYKTDLHNYAHVNLNNNEIGILYYLMEYDDDIKIELYKRDNNNYFIFNKNKKSSIVILVEYLKYSIEHPLIKLKIRKDKINKILEGS